MDATRQFPGFQGARLRSHFAEKGFPPPSHPRPLQGLPDGLPVAAAGQGRRFDPRISAEDAGRRLEPIQAFKRPSPLPQSRFQPRRGVRRGALLTGQAEEGSASPTFQLFRLYHTKADPGETEDKMRTKWNPSPRLSQASQGGRVGLFELREKTRGASGIG